MGGWRLGGWRLGAATIGALSGRLLGKTWAAVGGQLLARRRRGRRWKTYINYQRLLEDVEFSKGKLVIINFTLKKSNVFQKTLVIYIRLSTSSSTSSNVFQWAGAPGRRRRRRGSRGRRRPGRCAGDRALARAGASAAARAEVRGRAALRFAVSKQGRKTALIWEPWERNVLFAFKLSDLKQRLCAK